MKRKNRVTVWRLDPAYLVFCPGIVSITQNMQNKCKVLIKMTREHILNVNLMFAEPYAQSFLLGTFLCRLCFHQD